MPDATHIQVRSEPFVLIPCSLIDEVPDSSYVLVYAAMYRRGHGSDQGCWCSHHTLSKASGVYLKGVRRALTWLEDNGWIEATPRPGSTTIYQIHSQRHPDRNRPRSKTTPVENDLPPRSKTTGVPRSKTTYEQDPYNQIPLTREEEPLTPLARGTRADGTNPRVLGTNPRAQGTNPKKADPLSRKALPRDAVPADLIEVASLLQEFWEVKKGTRSQRVFDRVCKKLRQWSPMERQQALESSITAGWPDVYPPRSSKQAQGGLSSTERQEAARQRVVAFFEQHDPLARGDQPWPSASTSSAASFWDCSSSGPSPSSSTMQVLGLPG